MLGEGEEKEREKGGGEHARKWEVGRGARENNQSYLSPCIWGSFFVKGTSPLP